MGAFRVPFEVVAPADPGLGENTLLFEPPHSGFSTVGRNLILGPDLIFGRGLRFASVGVGNFSDSHILNPSIPDLLLAGAAFVPADPLSRPVGFILDEEIIALFLAALESDEDMAAMLGSIDRRYAYGISQSAAAISELLFDPNGLGQASLTCHSCTRRFGGRCSARLDCSAICPTAARFRSPITIPRASAA